MWGFGSLREYLNILTSCLVERIVEEPHGTGDSGDDDLDRNLCTGSLEQSISTSSVTWDSRTSLLTPLLIWRPARNCPITLGSETLLMWWISMSGCHRKERKGKPTPCRSSMLMFMLKIRESSHFTPRYMERVMLDSVSLIWQIRKNKRLMEFSTFPNFPQLHLKQRSDEVCNSLQISPEYAAWPSPPQWTDWQVSGAPVYHNLHGCRNCLSTA